MQDLAFLKVVTILLPTVFGMVLLLAGSVSHSSFDGGVGFVLLITAFCFFLAWFAPRRWIELRKRIDRQ